MQLHVAHPSGDETHRQHGRKQFAHYLPVVRVKNQAKPAFWIVMNHVLNRWLLDKLVTTISPSTWLKFNGMLAFAPGY